VDLANGTNGNRTAREGRGSLSDGVSRDGSVTGKDSGNRVGIDKVGSGEADSSRSLLDSLFAKRSRKTLDLLGSESSSIANSKSAGTRDGN